jgi:uncharacterized protein YcfJ
MHKTKTAAAGLAAISILSACASPPMGPTVAVMPAQNKPFDQFQTDDAACRAWANQAVSGQAEAANNRAVGTAVVGTILGAGLGAAIGGGRGAAIGAASGAAIGTGYGASGSQWAQMGIQQQYNIAYQQCMYARGNQVASYRPVYGAPMYVVPGYVAPAPVYVAPPPPPPAAYPPPGYPPPGYPPPPPPGM